MGTYSDPWKLWLMKTTTTGYKPGEKNLKSSTGPFDSHKWGMGTYSGLWKLWPMKTTTTGYKRRIQLS